MFLGKVLPMSLDRTTYRPYGPKHLLNVRAPPSRGPNKVQILYFYQNMLPMSLDRTTYRPYGPLEFGILKKDYKIAISKEIIFY